MDKLARKPSSDPVQEKLREDKDAWNKQVSSFITNLINFKKMINGRPSKLSPQKGKITEPIPNNPATIINTLSDAFSRLAEEGNSIIEEQIDYSKNRRQKQELKIEQHKEQESNLSQQLNKGLAGYDFELYSGSLIDNYLISEASNPISRFFFKLLNPGIGSNSEKNRMIQYRTTLLDQTAQIHKDLKKIAKAIVGWGPQSIFLANQILHKVENNKNTLIIGVNSFKKSYPQGIQDTGGKIDNVNKEEKEEKEETNPITTPTIQPQEIENKPKVELKETPKLNKTHQVDQAEQAALDIANNSNNFKDILGLPKLRKLTSNFNTEPDTNSAAELLDAYSKMLEHICKKQKIPLQTSLGAILALNIKPELKSEGQNLLGKIRHQLNPFGNTKVYRLDIYNLAKESRKITNIILDLLENDLNFDELEPHITELSNNIDRISNIMMILLSSLKGIGHQDQYMKSLEKGNVGNYGIDLDSKRKELLRKKLDRQQMDELTKMYK
jgi:hypothetical protein